MSSSPLEELSDAKFRITKQEKIMKYQFTWDHLSLMHRILTTRLVQMVQAGSKDVRSYQVSILSKVGKAMSEAAFKKGPPITFLQMEPNEQLFLSASVNRAQQDPEFYGVTEGNDPQVLESIQQATEYDELDVKVGDKVRSFDFEGRDVNSPSACYIEGTVMAAGQVEGYTDCHRYTIRVEREVWEGKPVNRGERFIYPPVNGIPTTLGRLTNSVVKID